MNETLEDLTDSRIVILDNCFLDPARTSSSLCEQLYPRSGIYTADFNLVLRGIEIINLVEAMVRKSTFCVIDETKSEIAEKQFQLNQHVKFFTIGQTTGYLAHLKGRQSGGRNHQVRRPWQKESDDTLKEIRHYADRLYVLLRELRNKDLRNNFTPEQKETYQGLIAMLEPLSDAYVLMANKQKRLRKPKNIRSSLKTNEKIIATAFTSAYQKPVLILTRDSHIRRLGLRALKDLKDPWMAARYGLSGEPQHSISIYGIKEYNSDREPVKLRI